MSSLVFLFLTLAPAALNAVELKPESVQAWDVYVRAAQARTEERARGQHPFLWIDENPDLVQRARRGEILVAPGNGESPQEVPHGLIHDWKGAVFIPRASLDDAMRVLDDYSRYKDFYRPMVVQSKILEQTPDSAKVTLMMTQKALAITAAVETDDDVKIVRVGVNRAYSFATSTHVREIADYGKPNQHTLPEGQGPGYIWRTFTLTRLEQRDGGVYAETEMVAMSRSIPLLWTWLVHSLLERLPRKILEATLQDTRTAVTEDAKPPSAQTPPGAQLAANL